jgi:hypothetical protein
LSWGMITEGQIAGKTLKCAGNPTQLSSWTETTLSFFHLSHHRKNFFFCCPG